MKSVFALILFISFSAASLAVEEKISAADYIETWKNEAVYQMVMHKIPASITLAQGLLESGNGNSRLAVEGNNHFGIKCHSDWTGGKIYEDDETKNECFRKYKNASESFEDHSLFLLRKRYEPLFKLDIDDYKAWAKTLKQCGYATNPKYPELLIGLIERYDLTRFDKEGLAHIKKGTAPERPHGAAVAKRTEHREKIKSSNKKEKEQRSEITISNNRNIALSDNRIKFIRAKKGDTPESIARDLELGVWQITSYNDVKNNYSFQEGEIVYLQPKRNKASVESYTVKQGDTLRSISQNFGIKQKKILKKNNLTSEEDIKPGTRLKLK